MLAVAAVVAVGVVITKGVVAVGVGVGVGVLEDNVDTRGTMDTVMVCPLTVLVLNEGFPSSR